MRWKVLCGIVAGYIIFVLSYAESAEMYDNKRALAHITTARVYYDVNIGLPTKLVTRLSLIDKTYEQLVGAGVAPEFVVGFRGKASYFVTRGDDYVFAEDVEAKRKVLKWIQTLKARGVTMEQCLIAASLQKVDPQDILPEIEIVQNGYISMIGYQAKGYSQIPMD